MSKDENIRYVLLLDLAKYFPDGKVPDSFKHMSLARLKKRIKYLSKQEEQKDYNYNPLSAYHEPYYLQNYRPAFLNVDEGMLLRHHLIERKWYKELLFKINEREETNMIILGYPCIGKTTLAQRDSKVIDLESSNFSINGAKPEGWHEIYCKVAIDLYKQGKIVFISQHKEVQDYMSKWLEENPDELVVVAFPAPWLKSEWCRRSKKRYDESQDEKDLRAYERIEKCFDSDIKNLEKSPLPKMVISSEFMYISNMIDNVIKNHEDDLKRKAEEESSEE